MPQVWQNGTANPYFVRFASSSTTTCFSRCYEDQSYILSLYGLAIMMFLGYATSGGDGTNAITTERYLLKLIQH